MVTGTTDRGISIVTLYKDLSDIKPRFDRMFDPNPNGTDIPYIPLDPSYKFFYFLTGLDFALIKNVQVIPNTEIVIYEENNVGECPGKDIILRLTLYYKF